MQPCCDFELQPHAWRTIGDQKLLHRRQQLLRLLIGNQPAGNLGRRTGGDDRLGTRSAVSAEDAVDVARGAGPAPLDRGEALFAPNRWHAEVGDIGRFIELEPGEVLAFLGTERQNVVVESGNLHPLLVVVQFGHKASQHVARIGNRAAKDAAVQIAIRAVEHDLARENAAETVSNRGSAGGVLAGVADHGYAALHQVLVRFRKISRLSLPTSSSPSITNFTLMGGRPIVLLQASSALMCVKTCPLSSVAPRA